MKLDISVGTELRPLVHIVIHNVTYNEFRMTTLSVVHSHGQVTEGFSISLAHCTFIRMFTLALVTACLKWITFELQIVCSKIRQYNVLTMHFEYMVLLIENAAVLASARLRKSDLKFSAHC